MLCSTPSGDRHQIRLRATRRTALATASLFALVTPSAAQDHSAHTVGGDDVSRPGDGSSHFDGFGMATYRIPRTVEHEMIHARRGAWAISAEAQLVVSARWDPPPRGRHDLFQTSLAMVSLGRALGPGRLKLEAMVSAEPITGSTRSLLLQTGETADGVNPLIDRQHPHDALMGLGAVYQLPLFGGLSALFYAARVGSPALGPTPFMHRSSAGADPMAPISHHFLDATHISHGVLTAGLHTDLMQLEASVFNGREPDHDRWTLDRVRFTSRSARVMLTPGPSWVIQASIGELAEPEQLHPGIDVQRTTLSATHAATFGPVAWSTTLAWGRNIRREAVVVVPVAGPPPIVAAVGENPIRPDFHFGQVDEHASIILFPERSRSAWLAETTASARGVTVTARFERALKDQLFGPTDPRHDTAYDVRKLELGLIGDVRVARALRAGLGGTISQHFLPSRLRSAYGDASRSYMVFARLALAAS
jgi:hypothetical protein